MQIQINDPERQATDELKQSFEVEVGAVLEQFATRLTRVEIHLRDVNANKGGVDKRCLIEARPRGMDPLVAEHHAEKLRDAFRGALERLERVLERRMGRLAERDRERPA